MGRLATLGEPTFQLLDPLDLNAVSAVTWNWTPYLASLNLVNIDSSQWFPSPGLMVSDGVTSVTKRGNTWIPLAPTITLGYTVAYVWLDEAIIDNGAAVTLTNAIRMDQQAAERSAKMWVLPL